MLFIAGLILSAARAFVGMAVLGAVVALLCGTGLLPLDCRYWMALAACLWLLRIHIAIQRQGNFKPAANNVERGYRNFMRAGAVVGVGLGLLTSFSLSPWIGSLVAGPNAG